MSTKICVLDTETLGIYADAVVLSVGIIVADLEQEYTFEELLSKGINIKLSAADQKVHYGRMFDRDTIAWWKKQGEEARKCFIPDKEKDVLLKDLPDAIDGYFMEQGELFSKIDCYQRGYSLGFDFSKIHHIYTKNLGLEEPYNRWSVFDIPTVFAHYGHRYDTKCGIDDKTQPGFIMHNSLHDAVVDWMRIRRVFVEMGLI